MNYRTRAMGNAWIVFAVLFIFAHGVCLQAQPITNQSIWTKSLNSEKKLVASVRELPFEEEYKKVVAEHGTTGYIKPSHFLEYSLKLYQGKNKKVLWAKKLWAYEDDKQRAKVSVLDAHYESGNLILVYRQNDLIFGEVYRSSLRSANIDMKNWMTAEIWQEFSSDSDYIKSAVIQGSFQKNNLRVLVTPTKSTPLIAHYRYDPKLKKAKWLRLPVVSKTSTQQTKP